MVRLVVSVLLLTGCASHEESMKASWCLFCWSVEAEAKTEAIKPPSGVGECS